MENTNIYSNVRTLHRRRSRTLSNKKVKELSIKRIVAVNIIASLILIIMIAMSYTEMVSISSNINIINMDNEDLKSEISSLEKTLKPLVSSNRIEKIALNKLGLIYPGDSSVVKLENSQVRVLEADLGNQQ